MPNLTERPPITFVVCTVRPADCIALLDTFATYEVGGEIIVVVDGRHCGDLALLGRNAAARGNVRVAVWSENQGLSASRNLGMRLARNDHIVFLDDDTRLVSDLGARYGRLFRDGYQVLGGPLRLPSSHKPPPKWLPRGLYYLLSVHTTEKKIWGGNFGIARAQWSNSHPTFRSELGRKGGGLQSGDDTTFIGELVGNRGWKQAFSEDLAVEHHIDTARYRISYLARRAFWQGRSEVRRASIAAGIRKEWRRAFYSAADSYHHARELMGATLLISCFMTGLIVELVIGRAWDDSSGPVEPSDWNYLVGPTEPAPAPSSTAAEAAIENRSTPR